MVLVSAADLAFQSRVASSVEMRLHSDTIQINAWVTNVLALFSALALVFAATSKVAAALAVVSPLYLALGLATLAKIEHMHSAVQPLDLIRVTEFAPLFRDFFGTGGLIAVICGVIVWWVAIFAASRSRPAVMSTARRAWIGVASSTLLVGLVSGLAVAPSRPRINALLLRVGAPEGQHREKARRNGFLLSFLSELPTLFVATPPNYTPAVVASAVTRYQGSAGPASLHPRVNLILYLVESMMDPADLGFRYTSDPIPNLRALRKDQISGYAIVPEEFGGSANTEFELLTGMTRSFLPEQSLPYRQYLKRSIPSLPRALKDLGYTTSAIQADPKYYYDRERVYDLLSFQHKIWLRGLPGVHPGVRGLAPKDEVVTDAIVQASHGPSPYFIFAFPSSTHSPYNVGVYRDSDLDIVGFESSDDVAAVKEYVNALREADRAIGKLVESFRHRPDPTIIAILGDHLPPLPQKSLNTFFRNLQGTSPAERFRRLHRVPLLVWANFPVAQQQVEFSTNALASFLLAQMGIGDTGFLALTDSVRQTFPVVGKYLWGADGRIWNGDSLPSRERALWGDYRLIQYDLLLGKQYSLRSGIPGWTSVPAR
jgi:hypothetical protein